MNEPLRCPVCEALMAPVDLPRFKVYVCRTSGCEQIAQVGPDGQVLLIQSLLERNALGDDRVRSAISEPHVANVKSFLEVFDGAERQRELAMATAKGGLRQILTQVENRVDMAIGKLSGYAMVIDEIEEVLAALREARDMVSPSSARTRGVAPKEATSAGSSE